MLLRPSSPSVWRRLSTRAHTARATNSSDGGDSSDDGTVAVRASFISGNGSFEEERGKGESAAGDDDDDDDDDGGGGGIGVALRDLRAALGGAELPQAALALYALVRAAFDAPLLACARSAARLAGALDGVAAATDLAARALEAGGNASSAAALPAMLQASWLLVRMAHGPAPARRALCAPAAAQTLARLLHASGEAMAAADDACRGADACAAVMRNAALAVLLLARDGSLAAGAGRALQDAGAIGALSHAAAVADFAPTAAALAAGALAALSESPDGAVAAAALEAFLRPAVLAHAVPLLGACQRPAQEASMQQQQQHQQQQQQHQQHHVGFGLAAAAVASALPAALAARPQACLRALAAARLVGAALAALPARRHAQLLAAHLAGSAGQRALGAAEGDCAADAPIALAQALALPHVHVTLPGAAAAAGGGGGRLVAASACGAGAAADCAAGAGAKRRRRPRTRAGAHAGAGAGAAALLARAWGRVAGGGRAGCSSSADDVHTDVLLARLLLLGPRLDRLVGAMAEETAAAAARGEGAGGAGSATAALLGLAGQLLARGQELSSSVKLGNGGGGGSSSRRRCSCDGDDSSAGSECGGCTDLSAGGTVTVAFGPFAHSLSPEGCRRVAGASAVLRSMLECGVDGSDSGGGSDAEQQQQQQRPAAAVRCPAVPGLSEQTSRWALARLDAWAAPAGGGGAAAAALAAPEAALLWVAADFWQADALQADCEDRLLRLLLDAVDGGGAAFERLLATVLALCDLRPAASARLRRLAARAFLRRAAPQPPLQPLPLPPSPAPPLPPALAALAARHAGALLPAVRLKLRDRLVALCVLEAPHPDADAPDAPVG